MMFMHACVYVSATRNVSTDACSFSGWMGDCFIYSISRSSSALSVCTLRRDCNWHSRSSALAASVYPTCRWCYERPQQLWMLVMNRPLQAHLAAPRTRGWRQGEERGNYTLNLSLRLARCYRNLRPQLLN